MNRKYLIYVENISPSSTEDQLISYFEKWVPVQQVYFLREKQCTKRSIAGFIRVTNDEELDAVMLRNQQNYRGKRLFMVRADQPQFFPADLSIIVRNIHMKISEEVLFEHFESCGQIEFLQIRTDDFAYISFQDKQGVRNALAKNNMPLKNASLKIQLLTRNVEIMIVDLNMLQKRMPELYHKMCQPVVARASQQSQQSRERPSEVQQDHSLDHDDHEEQPRQQQQQQGRQQQRQQNQQQGGWQQQRQQNQQQGGWQQQRQQQQREQQQREQQQREQQQREQQQREQQQREQQQREQQQREQQQRDQRQREQQQREQQQRQQQREREMREKREREEQQRQEQHERAQRQSQPQPQRQRQNQPNPRPQQQTQSMSTIQMLKEKANAFAEKEQQKKPEDLMAALNPREEPKSTEKEDPTVVLDESDTEVQIVDKPSVPPIPSLYHSKPTDLLRPIKASELGLSELELREPQDRCAVWVNNIPLETTRLELVNYFEQFGFIEGFKFGASKSSFLTKWAKVHYVKQESAARASEYFLHPFHGRYLFVLAVNRCVDEIPSRTFVIDYLSKFIVFEDVAKAFKHIGEVFYLVRQYDNTHHTRFYFVKEVDAQAVLAVKTIEGSPVQIERFVKGKDYKLPKPLLTELRQTRNIPNNEQKARIAKIAQLSRQNEEERVIPKPDYTPPKNRKFSLEVIMHNVPKVASNEDITAFLRDVGRPTLPLRYEKEPFDESAKRIYVSFNTLSKCLLASQIPTSSKLGGKTPFIFSAWTTIPMSIKNTLSIVLAAHMTVQAIYEGFVKYGKIRCVKKSGPKAAFVIFAKEEDLKRSLEATKIGNVNIVEKTLYGQGKGQKKMAEGPIVIDDEDDEAVVNTADKQTNKMGAAKQQKVSTTPQKKQSANPAQQWQQRNPQQQQGGQRRQQQQQGQNRGPPPRRHSMWVETGNNRNNAPMQPPFGNRSNFRQDRFNQNNAFTRGDSRFNQNNDFMRNNNRFNQNDDFMQDNNFNQQNDFGNDDCFNQNNDFMQDDNCFNRGGGQFDDGFSRRQNMNFNDQQRFNDNFPPQDNFGFNSNNDYDDPPLDNWGGPPQYRQRQQDRFSPPFESQRRFRDDDNPFGEDMGDIPPNIPDCEIDEYIMRKQEAIKRRLEQLDRQLISSVEDRNVFDDNRHRRPSRFGSNGDVHYVPNPAARRRGQMQNRRQPPQRRGRSQGTERNKSAPKDGGGVAHRQRDPFKDMEIVPIIRISEERSPSPKRSREEEVKAAGFNPDQFNAAWN